MLLGEGGLGVTGKPSAHYEMVENTCVGCHMGEERNHTYAPQVARCQQCHSDAENFDINSVQTDVKAMFDQLTAQFTKKGLLDQDGLWVPGTYPEAIADAIWNYSFTVSYKKIRAWASTTRPTPRSYSNKPWMP
jgi:hypothetical protein